MFLAGCRVHFLTLVNNSLTICQRTIKSAPPFLLSLFARWYQVRGVRFCCFVRSVLKLVAKL